MKNIAKLFALSAIIMIAFFSCATNAGSASPSETVAEAEPVVVETLVDDFESEDLGTIRYTYNDGPDGGSSVVFPEQDAEEFTESGEGEGAKGSNGWMRMHGNVTTDFQYGFAGMGVYLNEEEAPVDVNGYTGITFWVKGDGQRYRMEFISENITDFCYYGYTFKTTDEWTEVKIPFRFMLQETWGEAKGKTASLKEVTAIKFQTRGQPLDSFELYLDEINFYTEE